MNSIHRKLGVGLAVGITLLWLLASLASGLIIRHELGETADSSLRVTAQQLLAVVPANTRSENQSDVQSGSSASATEQDSMAAAEVPVLLPDATSDGQVTNERDISSSELRRMEEIKTLLGFVIRDNEGVDLFIGGTLPQTLLRQKIPQGFSLIEDYRVYVEHSDSQQRSILIAEPMHHRHEINRETLIILSSTLLLLIPASLVLAWWVVSHSLQDVEEVQLQIESRGGTDLTSLSTDRMPRELVPIAESVNRLLARLSRTLESERNFTTNSAHELRTPIASALAQTQRQIASLPEGAERQRARHIEQTLQELARTSEKLMQLARAESGSMINDTPANVYPVIEYLMDEFASLHREDSRLQLHCLAEAQFNTLLDADGMAILLRNLIDNALKYGAVGTPVDVVVDSERNEVRVINDGPVVPATELSGLKERFKRSACKTGGANDTNAGKSVTVGPAGSGLGLAIAETIASHAQITLQLRSPASGRAGGFEAILSAAG